MPRDLASKVTAKKTFTKKLEVAPHVLNVEPMTALRHFAR
jgi:hypothetical protein